MRNYWSAPLKADNRGSHYFLHSRPVRDSLCGLDINTWAFMALLRLQDKKNQKFQLLLIELVPGLGPLTCQGPVRAHRLPGLWAAPVTWVLCHRTLRVSVFRYNRLFPLDVICRWAILDRHQRVHIAAEVPFWTLDRWRKSSSCSK
jgi:hypothetical protein